MDGGMDGGPSFTICALRALCRLFWRTLNSPRPGGRRKQRAADRGVRNGGGRAAAGPWNWEARRWSRRQPRAEAPPLPAQTAAAAAAAPGGAPLRQAAAPVRAAPALHGPGGRGAQAGMSCSERPGAPAVASPAVAPPHARPATPPICQHPAPLPQLLLDLRPNEEHAQGWTVKPQTSVAVQAAADLSEHEAGGAAAAGLHASPCWLGAAAPAAAAAGAPTQAASLLPYLQVNTTAVVTVSRGMNHVEGGWPKEVDHTEAEQVGGRSAGRGRGL